MEFRPLSIIQKKKTPHSITHTHFKHHLRFPSFHHLRISSQIPLLIHRAWLSRKKFIQQQKNQLYPPSRWKKWLATSHNNQLKIYNSKILRNFYSFRASFVSRTIFFFFLRKSSFLDLFFAGEWERGHEWIIISVLIFNFSNIMSYIRIEIIKISN